PKVGPGKHRTGRHAHGNPQRFTYAHQGNAYRGRGGPTAARGHGNDTTDDQGGRQEDRGVQYLQAVVDHGGNDPAHQPGTRKRPDHQQDEQGPRGGAYVLGHLVDHPLETDPVVHTDHGGHGNTHQEDELVGAPNGVIPKDKDVIGQHGHQGHDGDQGL